MKIFAIAATLSLLAASSAALAQVAPAAPPAPAATPTGTSTLTLSYTGIETLEGSIMVALYDSETAYAGGRPVRVMMVPATATTVTVTIDGLAPGSYAIKSYHDIDGDSRMSTNPMGMPIEPFAFSNSARGTMGPASWAQAMFTIDGATTHSISFR